MHSHILPGLKEFDVPNIFYLIQEYWPNRDIDSSENIVIFYKSEDEKNTSIKISFHEEKIFMYSFDKESEFVLNDIISNLIHVRLKAA